MRCLPRWSSRRTSSRRPLSMDEPEDRIRMVFGLTCDDALPKADEQTQRKFLDYLKAHLVFPLRGRVLSHATAIGPGKVGKVTDLGLCRSAAGSRSRHRLLMPARGSKEVQVPLAGLHVDEEEFQLPDTSRITRLGCGRFRMMKEDETEEPPQFPIGTIAYYGPDDKTTTKIVAGVIKEKGAEAIIKRWVATDVMTNPKVAEGNREVLQEVRRHTGRHDRWKLGLPARRRRRFSRGRRLPVLPVVEGQTGKRGEGVAEVSPLRHLAEPCRGKNNLICSLCAGGILLIRKCCTMRQ